MRRVFGAALACVMSFGVLTGPAVAETRFEPQYRSGVSPSEPPPPGHLGSIYVDSAGCVFARIGRAWALRLNAQESPLCGFNPTYPGRTGQSDGVVPVPVASSAGPLVVTVSSHSTRYPGTTRQAHIHVPHGYRPAWDDGRINPHRGPQTAAGDAAINEVWTQTVPREAVNQVNPGPTLAGPGPAWVEAGRYASAAEARTAGAALTGQGLSVQVGQGTVSGSYRLMIGPYANLDAARAGYEIAYGVGFAPLRIRN
ncbi:MAG: SPOR domain-containing protein [Pseudomonadota bacterium]